MGKEFDCVLLDGKDCMLGGGCIGERCNIRKREDLKPVEVKLVEEDEEVLGKDAAAGEGVEDRLEQFSDVWSRAAR